MEKKSEEFGNILAEEENLLDRLSEKQKLLRKSVIEKDWTVLQDLISEINVISDNFQKYDSNRDQIQNSLKSDEIKPFLERLGRLRIKLLKCKVENKVIANYVNVTRSFITEVVSNALPQTRNKNYTRNGTITQPQISSVLVDVRG